MDNLFQFQSEGNVSEEEQSEEALLLKKRKDPSPGTRPLRNQERLGNGASRKNAALWTLDCWSTETLVRLLGYRTEQSKSVLSLQRQQALQTVYHRELKREPCFHVETLRKGSARKHC